MTDAWDGSCINAPSHGYKGSVESFFAKETGQLNCPASLYCLLSHPCEA
jgi:hypothetical protein